MKNAKEFFFLRQNSGCDPVRRDRREARQVFDQASGRKVRQEELRRQGTGVLAGRGEIGGEAIIRELRSLVDQLHVSNSQLN